MSEKRRAGGVQLGLYQGSIPAAMSMQQCVSVAAELGYDGLELALEDSLPLLPEAMDEATSEVLAIGESVGMTRAREGAPDIHSDVSQLESLARMATEENIRIHSIATMMLFFYPLSSPVAKVRDYGIKTVLSMLGAASILGADTILIIPGIVTPSTGYLDVLGRSKEVIRDLVSEASRLGIVMAIENVWNRFLPSPVETAEYIDSFASPYLGAYVDVANVLPFGYPQDWLRILGTRVKGVHFKDFRKEIGNILGFTHLLHGDVDWHQVTDALCEIKYDGYVTVEVQPLKNEPLKGLRDAKSSLDLILSRMVN
jgi:L-ribulose-5-phosphate 3-epimerase